LGVSPRPSGIYRKIAGNDDERYTSLRGIKLIRRAEASGT
jgi:hypothetical protein